MTQINPNIWPYRYVFSAQGNFTGLVKYDDLIGWLLDNFGVMDNRWTWRINQFYNNLIFYFKSQQDFAVFVMSCT